MKAHLDQMRATPGFAKLRAKFSDIDVDHDIPDGLGCDVEGTIRYVDKDLFSAVADGKAAASGLTPEQILECFAEHIETECAIARDDNGTDHWADISLLAHEAEAEKAESFGAKVEAYDAALAPLFIACKQKPVSNPAPDLLDLESGDEPVPELRPDQLGGDGDGASADGGGEGNGGPEPETLQPS